MIGILTFAMIVDSNRAVSDTLGIPCESLSCQFSTRRSSAFSALGVIALAIAVSIASAASSLLIAGSVGMGIRVSK